MALPRAVKKQAKEAEELQQRLNQNPEEKAALEAEEAAKKQEAEAKAKAEAAEKETSQAASPEVSEDLTKDQDGNWEKRFKGMKQLYDAEVPKLRGELETAYNAMREMKGEFETFKTDTQQAVEAAINKPAESVEIELTDEEREQYGDNWIGIMQKIAGQGASELAKQVVNLQQQVSDLKKGQTDIQKTVQVNTTHDFYGELGRIVQEKTGKSWKDINTDSEFHAFLAATVPYTKNERQFYLLEAKKNLDAETAAKFYIDFAGPSSTDKGVSSQTDEPDLNKMPEDMIQPGTTTGSGDLPPKTELKTYTGTEVTQFYRDRREGKYKGKEAEAREIEKDILAAGRAGRIVEKRQYASA